MAEAVRTIPLDEWEAQNIKASNIKRIFKQNSIILNIDIPNQKENYTQFSKRIELMSYQKQVIVKNLGNQISLKEYKIYLNSDEFEFHIALPLKNEDYKGIFELEKNTSLKIIDKITEISKYRNQDSGIDMRYGYLPHTDKHRGGIEIKVSSSGNGSINLYKINSPYIWIYAKGDSLSIYRLFRRAVNSATSEMVNAVLEEIKAKNPTPVQLNIDFSNILR
jgi:hypothetical protein